MFFNKRYAQASVVFQRARRNHEARICDAYLLREKARLIPTTASTARIQAFTAAANAFTRCVQDSLSKRVNEHLAYYGAAGECYLGARDMKNAGDSYRMAQQYAAAACAYREGGCFDEVVEIDTIFTCFSPSPKRRLHTKTVQLQSTLIYKSFSHMLITRKAHGINDYKNNKRTIQR